MQFLTPLYKDPKLDDMCNIPNYELALEEQTLNGKPFGLSSKVTALKWIGEYFGGRMKRLGIKSLRSLVQYLLKDIPHRRKNTRRNKIQRCKRIYNRLTRILQNPRANQIVKWQNSPFKYKKAVVSDVNHCAFNSVIQFLKAVMKRPALLDLPPTTQSFPQVFPDEFHSIPPAARHCTIFTRPQCSRVSECKWNPRQELCTPNDPIEMHVASPNIGAHVMEVNGTRRRPYTGGLLKIFPLCGEDDDGPNPIIHGYYPGQELHESNSRRTPGYRLREVPMEII